MTIAELLVEAGRPELLHAVEFGEQPAGAGRPIGGIFGGGLIAEVAAIDQEQHAPHAGVGQHPIGCGAGGEGLARAHGHLHERAGVIAGQRAFKPLDRLDLALAKAIGDERRHVPQPRPQRLGLGQPPPQRLGAMEGEDPPRARLGVGEVAEQGFGVGRDIFEPPLARVAPRKSGASAM